ncbi:MAG: hypothetical protein EOP86_03635 [Verrucomicrobiaceae bacterium]|nr:MAG: hypothetical protein EOP86_03635 [Verrucomicrobiaceae bacterium]
MLCRYSILLSIFLTPVLQAGGIYWSDRQSGARGIRTCALDGSSPASVAGLQGLGDPRGVVADARNGKLYFNDGARVMAAGFDFTARTAGAPSQIGTGTALRDLCLDRTNHYLYFTDENAGRIDRAALPGAVADGADGTFPKTFSNAYYLDVVENAGGWAVGSGGWRLFAGDNSSSFRILGSPAGALAPLSLPVVNPSPNNIRGIQIDPGSGWVYWCEKDTFRIRRGKYDGAAGLSDVKDVYTGLCAAHGLWLDQPRGRLYWVDSGTNAAGIGKGGVNRGDVDGSGPVELLVQNPSSGQPWDLDVDVSVTSFEEWLMLYFRKDAAASDREKSADPDGDTFTNGQEFLLAMNPLRRDTPPVTAGVWTDPETGTSWPVITFVRRPLVGAAAATPQVSTDLTNWSPATLSVGTAVPVDEGMERVTYRSDVSLVAAPRQFVRVKAEMQP